MSEQKGVKHDAGKPAMELLSSKWIEGVARVLTFGAKKYAAHNWRQGLAQSRLLGAALRHIFSYLDGENVDAETGLSHLYHASCCLMFASELLETHPELDDRWRPKSRVAEKSLELCQHEKCPVAGTVHYVGTCQRFRA